MAAIFEYNLTTPDAIVIYLKTPSYGGASISWGDGNSDIIPSGYNNQITHLYSSIGTCNIEISGNVDQIGHGSVPITGIQYLKSVQTFGELNLISLSGAFNGANNFININSIPNNIPNTVQDLSYLFKDSNFNDSNISYWNTGNVTDMRGMFLHASNINCDLNNWDTRNVTDMRSMFLDATNFNGNISNWDTGNVTDMSVMFGGASNINCDLNNWNTSKVTNMSGMFYDTTNFNGNISNWNTGNVTDMYGMFGGASNINCDLNNWNTSKVTNMSGMFYDTTNFNGNISNWDTGKVTNMFYMFNNANNFNQDLSSWNISNVADMTGMFSYTALTPYNFNNILNGWSKQSVKPNVQLDATYYSSFGKPGYNILTDINNGWTINAEYIDYVPIKSPIKTNFKFTYPTYQNNGNIYKLSTSLNNVMSNDFTLEPSIYYAKMDGIIQLSSLGVNNFYLKDINQLIIDKIILNGTPKNDSSLLRKKLSTDKGAVPVHILQTSTNAQIIPGGSTIHGNQKRVFFRHNGTNYRTDGFNV